MKNLKLSLCCFLVMIFTANYAQITTPKPENFKSITDGGTGSQPILNTIMHDLLDNKNAYNSNLKTIGSPYLDETYKIATVYYQGELQENFYVRHNILNDEIELKQTILPEEQPKALIRDKNIKLIFEDGKEIYFRKYKPKKENAVNGFVYAINDSATYNAYKVINAKFSEGHAATSSMVKEVPNRFSHFSSYYYSSKPEEILRPLPSNYKKFIKILEPDLQQKLRVYIKENRLNLKEDDEIKSIFDYLNDNL